MTQFNPSSYADALLGGMALGDRARLGDTGLRENARQFDEDLAFRRQQEAAAIAEQNRRQMVASELMAQKQRGFRSLYQQYNPPRYLEGAVPGEQIPDPAYQQELEQFNSYDPALQEDLIGQMGKSHAEQMQRQQKQQEAEDLVVSITSAGFPGDVEHNLKARGLLEYAPSWWTAGTEQPPTLNPQDLATAYGLSPDQAGAFSRISQYPNAVPPGVSGAATEHYRQGAEQGSTEIELAKLDLEVARKQKQDAVPLVKSGDLDAEDFQRLQQAEDAAIENLRSVYRRRLGQASPAAPSRQPGPAPGSPGASGPFSGVAVTAEQRLNPDGSRAPSGTMILPDGSKIPPGQWISPNSAYDQALQELGDSASDEELTARVRQIMQGAQR
jgi:hypothetical protein